MSGMTRRWGLALAVVLAAGVAGAEEWDTVATTPYLIKVRPRPGTKAKDIWAEGELRVSAAQVQTALEDAESYRLWMPYVKESRVVRPTDDGGRLTYTRLDLPVVSSRDYISHVVTESKVAPDGTGAYQQRWKAEPDAFPARRDVVRLRLNEGSWKVEPKGEGSSWVVYKFTVDPAGSVPGFLASLGQKDAVVDTLRAVEKRARTMPVEPPPAE
ncbi:SRPBCC family protein [Corallococcus sp. RDP092CA]|uniref:SRPBCC family protein n=1 Tax=Corallococcus sp. RDP092CA TaxID=3109369 RepID=UPI0035AECB8D